jgi:hypothetical protein
MILRDRAVTLTIPAGECALTKPTDETSQAEENILFDDVSDESLEAAATAEAAGQSLWGTITVSGCTCID